MANPNSAVQESVQSQNGSQTGYIILESEALQAGNLLEGTKPPATAMIIRDADWLRQITVPEMKNEADRIDPETTRRSLFGSLLRVQPNEVARWNLATGMKVQWTKSSNGPVILSVEGETDPEKIRNIKLLTGVNAAEVMTATRPMPIERNGNPDVRFRTLLGPQAFGQRGLYLGPEGGGKSTSLRQDSEATIELMPSYPKLFYMALYDNDRPEHGTLWKRVIKNAMLKTLPPEEHYRVEFYYSPKAKSLEPHDKADGDEAHWYYAWFVVSRARWLTRFGWDVVLDLESLPGIMLAFDRAKGIPKGDNDPIVSPGIHVSAIEATETLYSVAGDYPELGSSLTIRATSFGNYNQPRPPVHQGFEANAKALETLMYVFEANPKLKKPALNIVLSRARDYELFMDKRPRALREMQAVEAMRWAPLVRLSKENKELFESLTSEDELYELVADYDPPTIDQEMMVEEGSRIDVYLRRKVSSEERRINDVLETRTKEKGEKSKGRRKITTDDTAPAEVAHFRTWAYTRLVPFPPD